MLLLSACNKQPSAPSCADGAHKLECVASVENHKYKCMRDGCDYEEAAMPHIFEDSANCVDCGIDNETVTLGFTLAEDGKSYIVSSIGSCELKHINIPRTYNELPVTEIGDKAFYTKNLNHLYRFESITISEGIIRIGKEAFFQCTNLKEIKLPESLLYIDDSAFYQTSITEVSIPKNITFLGEFAFFDCANLCTINIPEGIKELHSTFLDCSSLKEIKLPISLEIIDGAFSGTAITHIDIPDNVRTIDAAFTVSKLETVRIGSGVKTITGAAFSGTMLKSVTIPGNVECIDEFAFNDCRYLEEVIIENGLTKIGTGSFTNCTSLTKIIVPESIECIDFIEYDVFENCPNIEYNVYEGMNYLGNEEKPYLVLCGAADGTKLVAHPDTKIFKDQALFDNDSITEVEIGANVKYIPPMALRGMDGVISATVSENNKTFYSVGNCIINRAEKSLVKAFNCSEIPSDGSVTLVDTAAFSNLGMLEVIYIPRGVENMLINFDFCDALKYLIIDIDVTKILSYGSGQNGDFSVYYCREREAFNEMSIVQNYDPSAMFRPVDEFWYDAEKYIYSEEEPTLGGNFWHWVDGVPTPWE